MIKIIQEINPYGFSIGKGAEVHLPKDITNTGVQILTIIYKDGDTGVSLPLICSNYKKTTMEFLDEICKLNTNHNSYYDYMSFMNQKEFN
jgi:AMMECR1 domain-containing protein